MHLIRQPARHHRSLSHRDSGWALPLIVVSVLGGGYCSLAALDPARWLPFGIFFGGAQKVVLRVLLGLTAILFLVGLAGSGLVMLARVIMHLSEQIPMR